MAQMYPTFLPRVLTLEMVQQRRWAILIKREVRQEWREPDHIAAKELPVKGSLSKWMSNALEAEKVEQRLRQ